MKFKFKFKFNLLCHKQVETIQRHRHRQTNNTKTNKTHQVNGCFKQLGWVVWLGGLCLEYMNIKRYRHTCDGTSPQQHLSFLLWNSNSNSTSFVTSKLKQYKDTDKQTAYRPHNKWPQTTETEANDKGVNKQRENNLGPIYMAPSFLHRHRSGPKKKIEFKKSWSVIRFFTKFHYTFFLITWMLFFLKFECSFLIFLLFNYWFNIWVSLNEDVFGVYKL